MKRAERIRVLFADDHPAMRKGIASILGNEPDMRLVVTPPSPPKKSGNISEQENTNSPTPSVIIANVVPARLVVT